MLLCLVVAAAAAGCGGSDNSSGRAANNQKSVEDVLQAGMAEADGVTESGPVDSDTSESGSAGSDDSESDAAESDAQTDNASQSGLNDKALEPKYEPEPESKSEPEIPGNENRVIRFAEGIDVDLTTLSSTMVYSEVYNMMYEPDNYIGKTIKMDGLFASYHDESTGNHYFACIIQDATACCAQGMEFILTDDYSYPDDYPEEGGPITVVGVFDTYMEGDYMYCTLRDASIV